MLLVPTQASAWGQEGHSIIAEIAQQRLTPPAANAVGRLLGTGRSLASVSSWADDVRDDRPETYNLHFVDLPVTVGNYDATEDCAPTPKGDCIVAALERATATLRCGKTDGEKRDALRFAVHFVGDIHQPLHTIGEARGGNDVAVSVKLAGAKSCKGGPCPIHSSRSNFHAVWDGVLIRATTWSWGAYVERLEGGWLRSPEAHDVDRGSPADWAEETHRAARFAWERLPTTHVVDDTYFRSVLPTLDRQLGVAGMRLARLLNEVFAGGSCGSSAPGGSASKSGRD